MPAVRGTDQDVNCAPYDSLAVRTRVTSRPPLKTNSSQTNSLSLKRADPSEEVSGTDGDNPCPSTSYLIYLDLFIYLLESGITIEDTEEYEQYL